MQDKQVSFDGMLMELQAKLASIGVTNISVPNACFRCGRQHDESERTCRNCGVEFWCEWRADWYCSRLTSISMGQDPHARKVGNAFAAAAAVSLVVVACSSHLRASPDSSMVALLAGLALGGWSVFDIWAYCHGWTTSIESCSHEAKPANTDWRTCGLILDLVTLTIAFYLLTRVH